MDISKKTVQDKIEAVNKRKGLDEALKTRVLAIYQEAEDNLDNSEKFVELTTGYKTALKTAPAETRRLQKEIELYRQKGGRQKSEDWDAIPTEELDQRLIIEKSKAANLDDQIKKKETDLAEQNSRPQLIREEVVAAKQAIETYQNQISTASCC